MPIGVQSLFPRNDDNRGRIHISRKVDTAKSIVDGLLVRHSQCSGKSANEANTRNADPAVLKDFLKSMFAESKDLLPPNRDMPDLLLFKLLNLTHKRIKRVCSKRHRKRDPR